VEKPEGKIALGKSIRRWEDNIKMYLIEITLDSVDWINLARDRDQWQTPVNTIMNARVPLNIKKLLSN
jgi:hypothetical protein